MILHYKLPLDFSGLAKRLILNTNKNDSVKFLFGNFSYLISTVENILSSRFWPCKV